MDLTTLHSLITKNYENTKLYADFIRFGTLGIGGFLITFLYNRSKRKAENDRIQMELFKEFNARYDILNDKLLTIKNQYTGVSSNFIVKVEHKKVLIDFFNLCAEEYFWYKKKRIDRSIWESWQAGMQTWYKVKVIKRLWKEEIKSQEGRRSYYLKENENHFFLPPEKSLRKKVKKRLSKGGQRIKIYRWKLSKKKVPFQRLYPFLLRQQS